MSCFSLMHSSIMGGMRRKPAAVPKISKVSMTANMETARFFMRSLC